MQFKKLSLACLATFAISASAQATLIPDELVDNGGFETGNLNGWTLKGDIGNLATDNHPHSGNFGLHLGATDSDTVLSQILNTVASVRYQLSYWMSNSSSLGPSHFSVDVGGNTLFSAVNLIMQAYSHYSFDFIGTGDDVLQFAARNAPSYFRLDDVSVTAVESTDIPDPGSLALLGIGLAALGLRRSNYS